MYNHPIVEELKEIKGDNGNFQTIKKNIGEDRLREFFYSVYPKFSLPEIEAITGIPDSSLEYWFKELKIPMVRRHIINRVFPGDEDTNIVFNNGVQAIKISTIKITPELAYLIGFTLGDGAVQKYMVEVFNKDKMLKGILFNILKHYGPVTEEERKDGLWRLRLSNGKIADLIKRDKKVRMDTLDYIFDNDELAKRFIAAFWDAEGSVLYQKEKNYYNLYLYNSNELILNKIKEFLNKKEIKFSVHSRKTRDKSYTFNNYKIQSKKILHRISIHKSSWPTWINYIGLYINHNKKRYMVENILKYLGEKQNG